MSASAIPAFCEGIQYFGEDWPGMAEWGAQPVIAEGQAAVASVDDPAVVFQTLLGADALRYLTLQMTGA